MRAHPTHRPVPVPPPALAALLLALIAVAGCTSSTSPDDDDGDAPAPITDLTVAGFTENSVTLAWTAPGDDGTEGRAARYEIRGSLEFIHPGTWADAVVVPDPPIPGPAGAAESVTIDELDADETYFFAITVFDEQGNSPGCSNCVEVTCYDNSAVTFADAALEAAVRAAVGEPTEPLLRRTVRQMFELRAPEAGIADLDGLQECIGLAILDLRGNPVTDLTPLAGLTQLFDLNLSDIATSDMTPLAGLTSLVNLRLAGDEVTDLTPLEDLAALEFLDASRNQVASLLPLAGLDGLLALWLPENAVTDLSPLAGLTALDDLKLARNAFTSVAPLGALTSLTRLDLSYNDIGDMDQLAPLTGMVSLMAMDVPLGSSAFLSGMTSLRFLILWNNGLTEIDGLAGLPALQVVSASVNRITDVQSLVDNAGVGMGDQVDLRGNPLSSAALDVQIPALLARGVDVDY